jgi:hypothetical protein
MWGKVCRLGKPCDARLEFGGVEKIEEDRRTARAPGLSARHQGYDDKP